MNTRNSSTPAASNARTRLLATARDMIRRRGFAATSVDELCKAAGVTKGAFFHHFVSKEALGVAVTEYWSATTAEMFAAASYHALSDPLDRVLAYIDFRISLMVDGPLESITCVAGTMVQETHATSDAIRVACDACISGHATTLEADLDAAIRQHGLSGRVNAASLALHTQAVLQGAFILAKAKGGPGVARDAMTHLRSYFSLLFGRTVGGANGTNLQN